MENSFILRIKIPFYQFPLLSQQSSMVFCKWFPLHENDFINLNEGDISVKFWFDTNCTNSITPVDEQEIEQWINIGAEFIYTDVTIKNIINENMLRMFRGYRDFSSDEVIKQVDIECTQLLNRIASFVLDKLNRIIKYARYFKGQYWLSEYPVDINFLLGLEIQAKLENDKWFDFHPNITRAFSIIMLSDTERFLNNESWSKLKEFISSTSRPDLHLFLLSEAESHMMNGNSRPALTEAITALEVRLHRFSESPIILEKYKNIFNGRLKIESLKETLEHLGLNATVSYVIPLLLNEDELPRELINNIQSAISARNNVVHNGQREVQISDLRVYISSIRDFCKILDNQESIAD